MLLTLNRATRYQGGAVGARGAHNCLEVTSSNLVPGVFPFACFKETSALS